MSFIVQYNGYTRSFASKSAAKSFAKLVRGGGCTATVKEV